VIEAASGGNAVVRLLGCGYRTPASLSIIAFGRIIEVLHQIRDK
jgi:hypothetical protein